MHDQRTETAFCICLHLNMATLYGAGEITELEEGLDSKSNFGKLVKSFCTEDDINQLFESIRISARNLVSSQVPRDKLGKKSMKRPMRVGSSAIGISEPISLKQALRGLSISQASEMAALKRLAKTTGVSGVLEAGTLKRSRRAAVMDSNENKSQEDMVEVSTVPQQKTSNLHEKIKDQAAYSSTASVVGVRAMVMELGQSRNLKLKLSSLSTRCKKKLPVVDEIVPASGEEFIESVVQDKEPKSDLNSSSSASCSHSGPKLIKPLFRNKNLVRMKNKLDSTPITGSSRVFGKENGNDLGSTTCVTDSLKSSPTSSSINVGIEDGFSFMDSSASNPVSITDCKETPQKVVGKADDKSRSREKCEFSQSSKSSIGEYSSSTSFSDESHLSSSSHSGSRPHMSKDLRWEAVSYIRKQHGNLGLRHFKLIKKLGGGDVGTVYLAELLGSNCLFALKVMDNEFLSLRKKVTRAETERLILQLLDHPFLPTLFAQFTTDKYSCLVIEYCPGGDLHVLRQKQPSKCFSEQAARFYVAEILLALEYLHMLGVVYRDLKPENIMVREDGHIMLTDFDLCLRCVPNPTLLKPASPPLEPPKNIESSCVDPFCLQQSWQVPCFTPRLPSAASKSRKLKSDVVAQVSPLPQLVVEPISARSNSFVGTHEYLAPEIIKGEGHGSPVDWWTFGILLYELIYGRTPFKGTGNEDTLANVVSQDLNFPDSPIGSSHARDLIRRLLRKQPENRLGSLKGAAEIKQHPFFEGLNWALIRCATPPEMPKTCDFRTISEAVCSKNTEYKKFEKEFKGTGEHLVFDLF